MGVDIGIALATFALQQGATVGAAQALFVIGSSALTVGTTLGSAALSAYTATQRGRQNVVQDPGIQSQIRQTAQPQRLVLGRATTSGVLFFAESKPPYTYYGALLAAHKVDGLESIFINNQQVFFDDEGFATSTPFRDGDTKYLEISFRNGDINQQIDPIIARDFPDMPATFRQRGHATMVIKRLHGVGNSITDKNEDYRRLYGDAGQFNPLARYRGALCYDPRDPSQVLGDRAAFNWIYNNTWKWSDNAVITAARALTHQWGRTSLFEDNRIDWDRIALGADECDKWEVDRDGNSFRRYSVNGVVQSTEQPYDVLLALQQAMGGAAIEARNRIYFVPGATRKPRATLHRKMIVGGFHYSPFRRDRALIKTVKTKFVDPNRDHQTVLGPVRTFAAAGANENGETTLDLRFSEGDPRSQRLGEYHLRDNRAQKTLEIGVTNEAWDWQKQDVITVDLDYPFAHLNGRYRVLTKTLNPSLMGYQLTLVEDDEARFDFGPADEKPFSLDQDTLDAAA